MGEITDKLKEKVKDAKDTVVDTTKDVAEKTKDTVVDTTKDVAEKTKDVAEKTKDTVVDTTKDVAEKTKDTVDSSLRTSTISNDKEYEEGVAGTNTNRNSDPLTEYSDKEPMTPAKLKVEGPKAVKRDPIDQIITSEGQTGTDTPEAQEEYRKRGMTKVENDNSVKEVK